MNLKRLATPLMAIAAAAGTGGALAADPLVDLQTSMGTIRLELYPAKAPKTVANFLQYVRDGFYDGTIFHRVIDGFMIQGGGMQPDMRQKPTRPPIPNEAREGVQAGLKNTLGTVAMARTSDPDSATAQFFINVGDNGFLDWGNPRGDGHGYAVFGKVVSGLDVVMKISKTPTGNRGPYQNVPLEPVVIESARVVAK